jgi:hypothetical protein
MTAKCQPPSLPVIFTDLGAKIIAKEKAKKKTMCISQDLRKGKNIGFVLEGPSNHLSYGYKSKVINLNILYLISEWFHLINNLRGFSQRNLVIILLHVSHTALS